MTTQSITIAANALRDALARRDREAVNVAAESLIELDAPLGRQWGAVAQALQHNGEHRAAIAALELWARQAGPDPQITFAQAAVLARAGRLYDAIAKLDSLPSGAVDPVALAYTRGTLALNLGQIDKARATLFYAATLNPRSGQAWLALAMTGKLDAAQRDALMDAAPLFSDMQTVEASAYHYAQARLLEAAGDPDAAFAAIEAGAAIMARLRSFDAARDDALTDQLIATWSRAEIEAVSARMGPADGAAPILVTGLPRSGTTLVEQILASHSAVAGGEELGLFRWVEQRLGEQSPAALAHADPAELRAARALYQRLVAERFGKTGLVVDKTLVASRSLGLFTALFPDAPIIWLRRDPADCAWSAFRTFFLRSVDWSWSLPHIGGFFRNEDRLLDHWTGQLGDRILVVPFAQLVADSAGWIDRITRFANLVPEPAQFEAHRSERPVTTASAVQVREPIDRRGIDAAAPFAARMEPFFAAYSD